jgi:transposase-like protein
MTAKKLTIQTIITNSNEIWKEIIGVPKCSRCGSENYYQLSDGRYKCKECGKIYSDRTNTILQGSKLDKWQWLVAMYVMCVNKGISLRELANTIGVTNVTAWKMQHKLRMYMGEDRYDMSGVVMVDEAHIGGWSGMHLKKKIDYMVAHNYMERGEKYRKEAILAASSEKKQHILCGVNSAGKSQVLHIRGQITKDIIKQVVKQNNITHIISDESHLYRGIKGVTTEQSNHSKHIYMTAGGHTSNPCENRFSWVKRIVGCYHTHTSERYLQLYLHQIIFKMNNRDLTATERFMKLGGLCCQKYVSQKDILRYDYTDGLCYPKVDEVDWDEVVDTFGGLVRCIEHKHKVYTGKRK